MLTVTINDGAQVTNDTLADLQTIIRRNTPSHCKRSLGDLTGQVLRIADKALRKSHVFLAVFDDGEQVSFVGRLPQYVSVEAAVEAVSRTEESAYEPVPA